MKYTVLTEINDGTICATKAKITCFISNSLVDKEGRKLQTKPGDVLPQSVTNGVDYFWGYSWSEWTKLNYQFQRLRKSSK